MGTDMPILTMASLSKVYMLLDLHNTIHPDSDKMSSQLQLGVSSKEDTFYMHSNRLITLQAGQKTTVRVVPSVFIPDANVLDTDPVARGCLLQREQHQESKFVRYTEGTCLLELAIRLDVESGNGNKCPSDLYYVERFRRVLVAHLGTLLE